MTSFLGKTYKWAKNEHFRELLEHLAVPAERIEYLLKAKSTLTLYKDGSDYVFEIGVDDASTTRFQPGVEFDAPIAPGVFAKSTYTVDDNVLLQVLKLANGSVNTVKRTFSADQIVEEITASNWDGKARIFYTAA